MVPDESGDDFRVRLILRCFDFFGGKILRVVPLELVASEPFACGVLPAPSSKVPIRDPSL